MNSLFKILPLLVTAFVLTACGGGGSSSAGQAFGPVITYTGTYKTGLTSGSIQIVTQPDNSAIVTVGGIPCLSGSFSERIKTELRGSTRLVGGLIVELSTPGNFSASFPDQGGSGEISIGLSRDIGCPGASVGTISVVRN